MNYWQKRSVDEINSLFTYNTELADQQLAKYYKSALKRIQREMKLLYADIKDGNITSVSQLYSYNRYYDLVNALNEELTKLGAREVSVIEPKMEQMYIECGKVIGKQFALGNVPDVRNARAAMKAIWANDGLVYSQRIWNQADKLKEELIQGLIDCASSGRSGAELAGVIAGKFSTSYSNAKRLVRTELTYIQHMSTLDRYAEANVEYVEILPCNDIRTCKKCASMAGLKFRLEDVKIGENVLQHPNCRCQLLPVVGSMVKMKSQYRGQHETPRGIAQDMSDGNGTEPN